MTTINNSMHSLEFKYPFNGGVATETRVFRPESNTYSTTVQNTSIMVTANDAMTGVDVTIADGGENAAHGQIFLPFPLIDTTQEAFSMPGLFKLFLKTQIIKQLVVELTPPVSTIKTVLLKSMITENKFTVKSSSVVKNSSDNYLLNNYSDEKFREIIGNNFICKGNVNGKSCVYIARTSNNFTLCTHCKGKLSKFPDFRCRMKNCTSSVYIEDDGQIHNEFCKIHTK